MERFTYIYFCRETLLLYMKCGNRPWFIYREFADYVQGILFTGELAGVADFVILRVNPFCDE